MSVMENQTHPTLARLSDAVRIWTEEGDGGRLSRWLSRELDADGVPIRLAVADWHHCLEILAPARRRGGDWPTGCGDAITGLVLATLRFSRTDGRAVMGDGVTCGHHSIWGTSDWMAWYRGTGIGRVLGWWFDERSRTNGAVPPPLPTWSAPDRVLAMLRPDWLSGSHFLAVDHRDVRTPCRFELFGSGRTWLGPEWGEAVTGWDGSLTRPRPSQRTSTAAADLIEWTYRLDRLRVTRSALFLRRRSLAMFSLLVDRGALDWDVELMLRMTMPASFVAEPLKDSRALVLTEPGHRGAAQALPIALPSRAYPTERGSFRAVERELILSQTPVGRRCWLPLLVSWDNERNRKTLSWRVLTVSERSRPVSPDRAFAIRVSWGRSETFVVYRSFGTPARRTFLGHQTTARFLIADFTEDGDLKPILTVE
jgi:hypothetical protein